MQVDWRWHGVWLTFLLSTLASGATREEALKAYVILKVGEEAASGVVVAFDSETVVVVTAAHALSDGDPIVPSFFPGGDARAPVQGKGCSVLHRPAEDRKIDLAFLKCSAAAEIVTKLRGPSFARAGSVRQFDVGKALTLIGRGRTRVLVSEVNNALQDKGAPGSVFRFTSETVERGYSGGPVLDDDWNLLGIITGNDPESESIGLAIPIEDLAVIAREAAVPFQLTPAPRLRISSFSAEPMRVEAGKSSRLQWKSENATACTLNGANAQQQSSREVRPHETMTYELVCTRGRSTERASVTIEVVEQSTPELTLEVSETEVKRGGTVLLSWASTDATKCRFADDAFDRATEGTRTVAPLSTSEYTLTCRNASGTKVTKSVAVTVTAVAKILSFKAAPQKTNGDEPVTLSWKSTGADECTISPEVGTVEPSGTQEVEPRRTTTYRLQCSSESTSDSSSTKVTVTAGVPRIPGIPACCVGYGMGCDITSWIGPRDQSGRPAPGYPCVCVGLGNGVSCFR